MFSLRIKELREEKGYSQAQLAKKLGIRQSTVGMWENGTNNPKKSMLETLATMFNCSTDYLLGRTSVRNYMPQNSNAEGVLRVPVLGSIPAGIPIEAIEDIVDWEELPASAGRGDKEFFGLKIVGDSMYPDYRNGDTIILRRSDTCESGDDCAVMVNGDEATFKRIRRNEKGITLVPLNPSYEPMFYGNDEIESLPVRILGIVVELRRRL